MATKIAISASDLRDQDFWKAEFPQLALSSGIEASRFASKLGYRSCTIATCTPSVRRSSPGEVDLPGLC